MIMSKKRKVEGYSNVYKDMETGVIHNRGANERQKYRRAKHQALQTVEHRHELDEMKRDLQDLKNLKSEIDDIKRLLIEMSNKQS